MSFSTSFLLPPTHPPLKNSSGDRAPLHLSLRPSISCPKAPSVKFPLPSFNTCPTHTPIQAPNSPHLSPIISSPFEGYSSPPLTSESTPTSDTFSPTSPLSCDFDSNRRRSIGSIRLRKSQSQLIMPSLFGLFKPSDGTGRKKENSRGMPRDTSTRSLSGFVKTKAPLIRKCNTVSALSSVTTGPAAPITTKVVGGKKSRLSFIKRISPSKSATFSTQAATATVVKHSSTANQTLRSLHSSRNPKTPSCTSLYPHPETEDNNLLSYGEDGFRRLNLRQEEDPDFPYPISLALGDGYNHDETNTFHSTTSHSKLAERLSGGSGCLHCSTTSFGSRSGNTSRRTSMFGIEDTVFCRLCYAEVSVREMWQLAQCQCRFCARCMSDYATFRIRQADSVIECPDANCDCAGELTPDEVRLLVSRDMWGLYTKCRMEREVDIDPLRTWCPTPGCETVVPLLYPKHSDNPVRAVCTVCSEPFCTSCSTAWHEGLPCYDPKGCGREIPLSASIKRCPRCRIPIERDEGCAQMQCRKCKHVFCWYCLDSLEDDFLLRHYDKGPCKNKLGHSRASVLWHRAQVLLIFCGFGLMLVVVSPLLLFVGPCLLCRTCRGCKISHDEEDDLSEDSV